MSSLFTPLQIRSIHFKNRIVVSPMCQYSATDGFANDWHLVHLGSRAVGGAALVIAEATAVSPEGRISPGDLGIWKDEHIKFLKRITAFIEQQGSVPGIQLAHAGRKASHHVPWKGNAALTEAEGAWQTLAPSSIAFQEGDPLPSEMSIADIEQFVSDFSDAVRRALQAGFKIIEIHAAHGYLLNEFLSPLSNHRKDEYGGSFENRVRLLKALTIIARRLMGEALPLFVRVSATDWVDGGWTMEDTIKLAAILKHAGADLIDCSSGGNSSLQQIPVGPLYQLPFAAEVKEKAAILTGAVGMINTAAEAEMIISTGKADMVLMAREFLRDPYFPLHAAKELKADTNWPAQYLRARRS